MRNMARHCLIYSTHPIPSRLYIGRLAS